MIAIGCDHGGFNLKEELKKYLDEIGVEYRDYGTFNEERTDYPIYAKEVASAVSSKECEKGILVCRSGHGMVVTANKFRGVRATSFKTEDEARFATADDDINVICFGSDYISNSEAIRIMRVWLATEFKGGRYQERIDMINEIENENMK